MTEVESKVAKAALAQGATTMIGKVGTVVSTIVLARLLFPADFGQQTVALMVMGLANMFSNFGVQIYIIQAKDLSQDQLNTCYTLNVISSAVLGLLVGLIGFALPSKTLMLREMLLLYGVMIFVSGLSYSQLALTKRQLRFQESSRAELAFSLTSAISRVAFAATGFGALCFPAGDLLGAIARWLASRSVGGVKLRLHVPNGNQAKELFRFGTYTTSVGFASFVANQVDKAVLTGTQSVANVGLYGFATGMAAMFYNAIIVPQGLVFMAAFARLQEDFESTRSLLANSSRFIFSMALPITVLLILESERIVTLIYGVRWIEAAPLIRILAVDYIVRSMFSGITGLQLAFGRAREAAITKWLNSGVFVVAMAIAWALKLPVAGYAAMFVAASILVTLHNVHVNGKLIELRLGQYMANLLAPASIAAASTVAWWLARFAAAELQPILSLAVAIGAWLTVYAGLSLAFNRSAAVQLIGTVRRIVRI